MDIIVSFFVCFIMFIVSTLKGVYIGYALLAGLILFSFLALRRGYRFKDVTKMIYEGGKKSFIVLQIFVLIGAIISVWMASGTVPAIVYYGIKFLNPKLFILSSFVISSIVSMLIGTSFGTIGTAGIALMVMARGGGINIPMAAGAIVAGAYFGDRCSPMSSSANLIAHLTGTDLYINIKNMIRTSIIPLVISLVLYGVLSFRYPLNSNSSVITVEIAKNFYIGWIALVPAAIIFLFSAMKVNVKISMVVSITVAALIAVAVQKNSAVNTLRYIVFGYKLEKASYLKDIIKGGGIVSMLKTGLVVFISSAFTGIFERTGMLKAVEELTQKAKSRTEVFFMTIVVSVASAIFGCTQTLAIILTNMMVNKTYEKRKIPKEQLAVNLENTAIVISPLIPWNIAVLLPLTSLMAGFNSIFYCFYLYLIPLVNLFQIALKGTKIGKVTTNEKITA